MLTREQIIAAADIETISVNVPEWGGEVMLRGMSAADRDSLEMEIVTAQEAGERLANFRARVVARCLINGDGKRIFSDSEADLLGNKSANAIRRLFPEAQRLSGMGKDAVEEIQGN